MKYRERIAFSVSGKASFQTFLALDRYVNIVCAKNGFQSFRWYRKRLDFCRQRWENWHSGEPRLPPFSIFSSLVILKVSLIFPRLVLATKQLKVLIWSTVKITKLQTNTTARNWWCSSRFCKIFLQITCTSHLIVYFPEWNRRKVGRRCRGCKLIYITCK